MSFSERARTGHNCRSSTFVFSSDVTDVLYYSITNVCIAPFRGNSFIASRQTDNYDKQADRQTYRQTDILGLQHSAKAYCLIPCQASMSRQKCAHNIDFMLLQQLYIAWLVPKDYSAK